MKSSAEGDGWWRARCQQALALALRREGLDLSSLATARVCAAPLREDQVRLACAKFYPFGAHGNRTLRTLWLEELDRMMERLGLYPPDRSRWPAVHSVWALRGAAREGRKYTVSVICRDGDGVTRVALLCRGSLVPAVTIQDFLEEARPI